MREPLKSTVTVEWFAERFREGARKLERGMGKNVKVFLI